MDEFILKTLYDNGMIWLYFGELVSADSNLTDEQREEHIKQATELRDRLNNDEFGTTILWLPEEDRIKIEEYCNKAINILKKEIENGNIN